MLALRGPFPFSGPAAPVCRWRLGPRSGAPSSWPGALRALGLRLRWRASLAGPAPSGPSLRALRASAPRPLLSPRLVSGLPSMSLFLLCPRLRPRPVVTAPRGCVLASRRLAPPPPSAAHWRVAFLALTNLAALLGRSYLPRGCGLDSCHAARFVFLSPTLPLRSGAVPTLRSAFLRRRRDFGRAARPRLRSRLSRGLREAPAADLVRAPRPRLRSRRSAADFGRAVPWASGWPRRRTWSARRGRDLGRAARPQTSVAPFSGGPPGGPGADGFRARSRIPRDTAGELRVPQRSTTFLF